MRAIGDFCVTCGYPSTKRRFSNVGQVLSRGRIQLAERLEEGDIVERGIKFTVTPEMTPSFRVVTFAPVDNHIVSDSIYVTAEATCTTASQVFHENKDAKRAATPSRQPHVIK